MTGRTLDSFKFQEITAGCWKSACCGKAAETNCSRKSISRKSFVFHSHPPPPTPLFCCSSSSTPPRPLLPFPFPPLCAALLSHQQTGSAQRQAEEWRGRDGREDRAGKLKQWNKMFLTAGWKFLAGNELRLRMKLAVINYTNCEICSLKIKMENKMEALTDSLVKFKNFSPTGNIRFPYYKRGCRDTRMHLIAWLTKCSWTISANKSHE